MSKKIVSNWRERVMGNPGAVNAEELKAVVAKREEEQRQKAAEALAAVFDSGEIAIQVAVKDLRAQRKMERARAKQLRIMSRAFDYALETGNPFPLFDSLHPGPLNKVKVSAMSIYSSPMTNYCQRMGIPIPDWKDPVWQVPFTFKSSDAPNPQPTDDDDDNNI